MNKSRTAAVAALALAAFMLLAGSASARDRNHDRIPDRWEKRHRLSLKVKQAKKDQDRDGLDNRGEFKTRMNPRDADSDDDGIEHGDENAGTIQSFEGDVLTIALAGGGTVTARVTDETELECPTSATASSEGPASGDDEGDEDHSGPGRGDDDHGEDDDDHGDDNDDHGDDDAGEHCGTDQLTTGRTVREAELELSDGRATFHEIELG